MNETNSCSDDANGSDEATIPSIGVCADSLFSIFGLSNSSNSNSESKIEQNLVDALAIIFDRLELVSRGECGMRCLNQGIDIKAACHPSGIRAYCSLLAISLLICYYNFLKTIPNGAADIDEISEVESNVDYTSSPIDYIISHDLQNEITNLISSIFSNERDEFIPEVEFITAILYDYLFEVMKSGRDIFVSITQALSGEAVNQNSNVPTTKQHFKSTNSESHSRSKRAKHS